LPELDKPYLFRYVEDPADVGSVALGKSAPLRPAVAASLGFMGHETPRVNALIDSGSERVFAAPALARQLQLDLDSAVEIPVGIGGAPRKARFATVSIRLFQSPLVNEDAAIVEWAADVGFLRDWDPPWAIVLGRDGFLDQFTVTMHGGVPAVVLESWSAFDERFGVENAEADNSQPRFKP
jgi:hypothetical protein